MGATISVHETEQAARRRSKTIDDGLEADRLRQARTVRVLMLGLSGAGKSTLAKQVRLIHDQGFTDNERHFYKDLIRRNLASAILSVMAAMEDHGICTESRETKDLMSLLKQKLKAKTTSTAILDLQGSINDLMSRTQVWEMMDGKMSVEESASLGYLLGSSDRILAETYVPNDLDILRARYKTTGLNEVVFSFKGLEFRLCDVDGQSSLKTKWLQNFDTVSAIIFTVSMGSYVIKSHEKEDETELHDAVRAFQAVCNYPAFEATHILLFLNKSDVFHKQLKEMPLSSAFALYKGDNDPVSATAYIRSLFEACIEQPTASSRLTTQVTNATDTSHIRGVFDQSLAIIVDNT